MNITADAIVQAISEALDHAMDVEQSNRNSPHSDSASRAWDAGRVDGLRQALDIALKEVKQ